MKNVRVFFTKRGDAKYLSHLDVMRCFTRALNRSGLEVWYTQGFNTHAYLTFACPLSLGFESEREALDFRLEKDGDISGDIPALLNAGLPDGIRVFEAAEPVMKHTDIRYALWRIVLPCGDPAAVKGELDRFFSRESVPVMKKTKRGEKEEDALSYVKKVTWSAEDGCCVLDALLVQSTEKALNPRLLLQAFTDFSGVDTELAPVTRTELYTEDMRPFR